MRSRGALLGAGAGLLLPTAVHAAAVGTEGIGGLLWEVGNLLLLLVVLFLAARKPVTAYLADRRRGIAQDIDGARQLLEDAEARLAEWSARADRLEDEVAEIKAATRKAAEREREAMLEEARATAERIRRSATGAVDRELRMARAELQRDAAELAVEIAGHKLREEITDRDRQRLLDEFVERVEHEEAH